MPRPTQKVARGRALRADGRKLFTKLVDSDDENSSIESDWEDDNDVSDSDSSQDAHQTMCNLFSHSLQRHLRSKTSVRHPTVCLSDVIKLYHLSARTGKEAESYASFCIYRRFLLDRSEETQSSAGVSRSCRGNACNHIILLRM